MFFVSTAENPTDSICKLVSCEQPFGLGHLSLAMHPLRLYWIEPWTLLGKQAGHYAHSVAMVLDLPVVSCNPTMDELALVPTGIVPDQKQSLPAHRLKPLAAPLKKLRGYGAHRTAVDEPQPSLPQLRQEESIAGEGFRVGIVSFRLFFDQRHWLPRFSPRVQARSLEAAPPGLVLETKSPRRMAFGEACQALESPFLLSYSGSGLSIHRLAFSQRTPTRLRVARMVSPVTRLCV